ncbi:hypothetical protein [Alteromonas sp. S167]|uniref:hypothetical protein n=1 Tax=Alteromonas sp. S167 TaxID=3117402 RepID=UPI002FE01253
MSNDLLFPILPRNTKVPVEVDERVKKVQKTKKSEHFSEDDNDAQPEVRKTEVVERASDRNKKSKRNSEQDDDGLKHIDINV